MPHAIPGPRGLPLIGHAWPFVQDNLGFLLECARRYGDVVRLDLSGPTVLVVAPGDIQHILVAHASNFGKSTRLVRDNGRESFGRSVFTVEGDAHRSARRGLQPAFRPSLVEPLAAPAAARAAALAESWGDGAVIDAGAEMGRLVRECTAAAVLGGDRWRKFPGLGDAMETRREFVEALCSPWAPVLTRRPRLVRAHEAALRLLEEACDESIRDPGADVEPAFAAATGADFDRVDLRCQLIAILIAGYETTAAMLSWTLFQLASRPDLQTALREESAGGTAAASMTSLRSRVLAESLRLFPPTWLFVRVAREDDRLPSGAEISAGTKIYLSQYVSHRQPRYFPDPERFDPDRFTAEEHRRRPGFSYFPFGGGPRHCLGEGFSRAVSGAVLGALSERVTFDLVPGQRIRPKAGVTLQPGGPILLRVGR